MQWNRRWWLIGAAGLLLLGRGVAQEWQSAIVHRDSTERLVYLPDANGNRIPDFSYAGYRNGNAPIPRVPEVVTIVPVAGDNTGHIQNAISAVAARTPDAYGIRGAVLLGPGVYDVYGTILLNTSGIVLRGAGDGEDTVMNTVIRGKGNSPAQRTIIVAGGGNSTYWRNEVAGTRSDILDDTVHVGDRSFRVAHPELYAPGDNVVIVHDGALGWLQAIGFGGTATDPPWAVGEQPIVFNRYVAAVSGDTVTIDAPVFNHLVRSQSQCYMYRYARTGLVTDIGIENLRIDIETAGGVDENHAWNAIDLYQVEDAWVTRCTMLHFGLSGIRCNTATRITVDSCSALDPVSIIEGGKRYNFNVYTGSQLILFSHCIARNGRHHYVSNGISRTSGCVFLDCQSIGAYASSEGHRWWSTGLLYDNLIERSPNTNGALLGLYNRGDYGTSHGWGAAHSVAWRCDLLGRQLIVQQPPTAQNYAIGCSGDVNGDGPFPYPTGYIEGTNQAGLSPRSLYLAQLEDRLHPPVEVQVKRGWNMRSLPVEVLDPRVTAVYPPGTSGPYLYDTTGYTEVDTVLTGIGYWIKCSEERILRFTGAPRIMDTLTLRSGWNLIGTLSTPSAIGAITVVPDGILASDFIGYENGYVRSDILLPGHAYWIKTTAPATLILR